MANVNVTANFAINTYTLNYAAGPNGSLTGMTSQTVDYGMNGTAVTAVPDTGYHFTDWTDSSTANPRTDMNVMANVNVTANFAIDAPANVIVNPGAGSYATLKDAFEAINAGTHTGAVNVSIVGDTTETVSAVLNASGTGSASYTSVNIFPNGSRIVSGAIPAGSPLVDLNGADNVTFNGLALEGNTGSLTLANTTVSATAGTSTIRFINGAANNTVTNCSVLGSSTGAVAAATGNILISTSTGGANSGNSISHNAIGPAGANLPTKGVTSLGSSTPNNNSLNVVDNNNIYDFFSPTVSVAGISLQANSADTTISNNRLFQTAPRTFTGAGLSYTGIAGAPGAGNAASITGNTIGFGAADGTGTTMLSGSTNTFAGISFSGTSTTVATSIQNNTISGINQSSAGNGVVVFSGIFFSSGRYDVGTVTGNKIGSLDGSSTITLTLSSNGAMYLIRDGNSTAISNAISNNQIGAITINGTGTGNNGFRGILAGTSTGATTTISNNQIGGSGAGAITDSLVGGYAMYAIASSAGNVTITGNTIQNISGNSNLAATIISSGMLLTGTGTAGPNTISGNVIGSLSNNSGAASNSIYAMYCSFPASTANVVERNLVHSLSMTSSVATGQLVGILPVAGSGTYKNNMVRLGLDAAGNSITTGFNIFGMFEIAGTNGIYDNSVYIGGSGVAAASSTFGFVSNVTTGTRAYVDNIFWNARSNASGTGKNYAISLTGLPGAVSDYNDLFATGTGTFVGLFGGLDRATLADWQTATGLDANSISANPQFIAPTGDAVTGDLHLNCGSPATGNGTPVAGITNDYDGDARNAMSPAIGADEPTFVAPTAISAVSRKTHGAAGDFDVDLPLAGPVGVEPRNGGATGDYQIVVTFATPVTIGSATVNAGTGSVASATGNGTNTITVDLTGVTNAQYLTVSLNCADDGTNLGDVSVTMAVLLGDVNGNGMANGVDVSAVKSEVGVPVTISNFRADVGANGSISASDVAQVKAVSGSNLPPAAPNLPTDKQ